MAQRDVKNRIASVKNIQKITRAMEMVAAARLRRAEQRIDALRPYAGAIRRMTRQAAEAAGNVPGAADPRRARAGAARRAAARHRRPRPRGRVQLADHPRRRARGRRATQAEGREIVYYATGRRGVSSLTFRGIELERRLHRLHRPPRLRRTRARSPSELMRRLRRRQGRPRRDPLQRLHLAAHAGGAARDAAAAPAGDDPRGADEEDGGGVRRAPRAGRVRARPGGDPPATGARLRRDLDLPGAARVDRVGATARA